MTSILTGDIIRSRQKSDPKIWLTSLKEALTKMEANNKRWEIYRGDSFQMEIPDIKRSFEVAIYIKACIKMNKGLDVRLAIGLGDKSFEGESITESNGEVFLFSGETLETLKKEKVNLKIKTRNAQWDEEMNLYFKLASMVMDHWTPNSAEIVKLSLEQPNALQHEIARQIGISQNTVSERQKRARLDELLELNQMFKQKLNQLK
ncbi:MAG: transcriptional regulator [Gelidibacter sp.]